MPIYEYTCQKCKSHIEILQKVTDKPLTRCRKCGGKLEKEWSQTSFQLKGSGWYVTDYAGKKTEASEASDAKEKKSEPTEAAVSKEGAKKKKTATSTSASSNTSSD